MKRVTNGFAKLSIAELSQQLDYIVTGMTGNTYFTNLQTEVQALSTAANSYYELVTKAANRDKQAIIIRDAASSKIIDMLHDLGADVTATAKGNLEILNSSGFPYVKDRKNSPAMEKPAPPRVSLGVNNGEIDCKTMTQPGLKSVNYYITSDPATLTANDSSLWTIISYNKTKFTFTALVAGQRYYIKVGLVGVRGQEVISDPITYIPQ